MARAALNWSLANLAKAAGVHRNTISNYETEKFGGSEEALIAIRRALETAGVIFVDENGEGPGVRLRKVRTRDEALAQAKANLEAMTDEEDAEITASATADPDSQLVESLIHRKGKKR
ncbi:XRE family transcriptional regulator [Mesorhizobium sp. DCY119]|nr:XRE family transcriptional regulator [Mesorhizobium sp. DCY119]